MIKENGDWTWSFIEKLYQAKKQILKVDSIKIEGVDPEDIFWVLLHFDDNV